jgi:hypothetical protein
MALPACTPTDEPRAYLVRDEMPPGHTTHYVDDDRHWPHLKPGETALVDTSDRTIIWGELYLLRQFCGPMIWQICKEPHPERVASNGRPTAWMRPLNNPPPRLDAKGRWNPTGCHMSDGPIYLDALQEQIIGRVVGLFVRKPYDPAVGIVRKGEAA